jgi:hypothetical protein
VNLLRSNSRWNERAANQRANAKAVAAARRSPRRSTGRNKAAALCRGGADVRQSACETEWSDPRRVAA